MQITLSETREKMALSEALRDILACGVISINRGQFITAMTPEAAALTGLKAADVTGQPLACLPAPLAGFVASGFRAGESPEPVHLTWRNLDGVQTEAHVRMVVALDQDGVQSAVVTLIDLAAAQQLDGNLRQLERLASIGALSANLAHEIRNALVAIKTFLELLVEQNRDVELAALVGREMQRIDSIAGQMLTFSGPVKGPAATVSLHASLDQSLQLVQHQINQKKIELVRVFEAGTDSVSGNSSQLQQAFLNLLFNALEAASEGGELRVATAIIDDRVPRLIRVSISDTGPGIPARHISRLLEPFFTTKPNGTGLGLPITYQIVQEHGGAMLVRTEAGKGTTFCLDFPVAE